MFASNTSAANGAANYIEDVFSTYLYTGNGSSQTITNGIDLSGKGGMVWQKVRTDSGSSTQVFDTNRGAYQRLSTAQTNPAFNWSPYGVTAFGSTGFTIADTSGGDYGCNGSPGGIYAGNGTYVSWTFRKQPKFFDVVTYTGNSTAGRTISHNLGSVPGCIIIKCTSNASNWVIYHRSIGSGNSLWFTTNASQAYGDIYWDTTDPTSTNFTLGSNGGVNGTGETYVAYLFAHNAGGFGLTGTDNVISCGSFTTDASGYATVNLGYEPQWVMLKATALTQPWRINDVMRGWSNSGYRNLYANASSAEDGLDGAYFTPTATGFTTPTNGAFSANATFIYIAIRRGPMKVPTSGTSVFAPYVGSNPSPPPTFLLGNVTDLFFHKNKSGSGTFFYSRLQGANYLNATSTAAEAADSYGTFDYQTGAYSFTGAGFSNWITWLMRRAPSFFDEVCYTGTGVAGRTVAHNLTVVPELIITKNRSNGVRSWAVLNPNGRVSFLNQNGQQESTAITPFFFGNNTIAVAPTATNFTVGTDANTSAENYVAYLFATCAGVSKVGSYTGTGTAQTINCGFTAGARFVLIKRTDSTGNWGVLDTARGMVSGTDPYLNLNTTAAEVNANNVYTTTGGFQLVSSDANFNASGGTYIFLAVA